MLLLLTPLMNLFKTIEELQFYSTFKIICVAIKREQETIVPTSEIIIHEHDILYFAGEDKNVEKLIS